MPSVEIQLQESQKQIGYFGKFIRAHVLKEEKGLELLLKAVIIEVP